MLYTDLNALSNLLKEKCDHWDYGSGDSGIRLDENDDGLIFFKTPKGIFIEDLSSVMAPLIKDIEPANIVTHYVGGDPFDVPDICLMDEQTALCILSYAIENNGELHPKYKWVYIYDYIPYRYDEFPEKEFEERKRKRILDNEH